MKYKIKPHYSEGEIRELLQETKIHSIKVYSAVELAPLERLRIEQRFKELFKIDAEYLYLLDPSLIAGLKVKAGDLLIENTIKHRLEKAVAQLKKIDLGDL